MQAVAGTGARAACRHWAGVAGWVAEAAGMEALPAKLVEPLTAEIAIRAQRELPARLRRAPAVTTHMSRDR